MQNKNSVFNLFQLRHGITIRFVSVIFILAAIVNATDFKDLVSTNKKKNTFTLAASGQAAPLWVSSKDYPGLLRVQKHLQRDIAKVTRIEPAICIDTMPSADEVVIIGTIDKSPLIDELVQKGKLNIKDIKGKWDATLIQVVEKPFDGVKKALVVAGSNKRGAIYGMYEISSRIGVSPWYWWADVPVKEKPAIYILPGQYVSGEPKVKYRGIFLNDEAPALTGWTSEKFGGYNAGFYEHVFELIMRLRGNFLWPAMWNNAFADDDPQNMILADEYGIVMSTSHHEPMMRADKEWNRYGVGPWEYSTNAENIYNFWVEGAERYKNYECVFTLGMRGQEDRPMSEGENIELLEKIISDQREILKNVINDRDITDIPQVWCLYKEVQSYYEKGMRVPDDVILLWSDDNWGNIRRLPLPEERNRNGGAGVYYHFDYVGGPRNHKWLNTTQISRVWEQMHLAYKYNARKIWIVNVGDLKPMEFPISFFLDYAWDPEKITADMLPEYTRQWAEEQFGKEHAAEIAYILTEYTRFNSRRKPELLETDTYSLINYREAEKVVEDYNDLYVRAKNIYNSLSIEYRDAFYQLVLHPVEACSNLNEMYVTVGKNRLYAKQFRNETNNLADKAIKLFNRDAEITNYYNHVLADGKWNHMMDQTHIGYTYWQQPEVNIMPSVERISTPVSKSMGVAIEGSKKWWPGNWPGNHDIARLPEFDPYHRQSYYIEIYNLGNIPFDYEIVPEMSWVKINQPKGKISSELRTWVSIDWDKAPKGDHLVPVTINGPNNQMVVVEAPVKNPESPKPGKIIGFVESNGYISIEAAHYSKAIQPAPFTWQIIPNLGRTLSAVTILPVTSSAQFPVDKNPRLEYKVYFFNAGEVKVKTYLSPTQNFQANQGLRYAVSFDNEKPQIINMHENKTFQDWEESVRTNVSVQVSTHKNDKAGEYVLKFWMVDPAVVLQKIVIETTGTAPSYLGPPESYNREISGKK
ncbi:MAG: glycosyl hydrolase 115 family protein [Calditrichaceae bacterium]|nr:glycosyl hydrolase 115 family protein [Calditrichaceae bacterium]MBN2708396.1 glycosyl hydrolase 115 family protein [Calditrichaceae bacterium]